MWKPVFAFAAAIVLAQSQANAADLKFSWAVR
jgi:hypothetical protein